jgi:hypothetical protein
MIKKIYLTRSETRAMSADHPIGDPTGGPAYGEKNDPISAAISLATMYGTASAGFAAMTVMQGITFAGAAISLVGNVTGNAKLMKIGAIAGIAGGLGSFAESQGLFSSGNLSETLGMGAKDAAASGALTGAPAVGPQTPVVDGVQVNAIPDAGPNLSVTTDAAGNVTQGLGAEALNVNAPGGAVNPLNAGPNNLVAPAAETIAPAVTAPASELLNTTSTTLSPGVNASKDILGRTAPQMSYAPGFGPNASVAPQPGTLDLIKAGKYADAAKSAGSGAMDMLKNNPTGAYVAAQAIGGVADWLSGKTDAEIAALKANTGFADAKAQEVQLAIAREERRRANMANRYTSISPQPGAVVTPYQQPGTGIVAGAMQQRPA